MRKLNWRHLVVGAVSTLVLTTSAAVAQNGRPDYDRGRAGASAQRGWGNDDFGRDRRDSRRGPRSLRGYQDPAFARGFSDGWERGADDRRDRDRYDPVRHGDYRSADDGYSRSYGSKDAYKNNYRAGFRQGYEEGYRSGQRYRR